MKRINEILVTTTSTLENIEIIRYLKPISSHVVAGTNFFSDFIASFSDVFGGRSATYQKQLTSIYNEAILNLKISAHEIGANCIVGMKVDLDEISGKGKSMFMITATGTAVIIQKKTQEKNIEIIGDTKKISIEEINILIEKKELLDSSNTNKLKLFYNYGVNESDWKFIIDNNIYEIFDYAFDDYKKLINDQNIGASVKDLAYDMMKSYCFNLSDHNTSEMLYKRLLAEQDSSAVRKILKLIVDCNFLNIEFISQNIIDENFENQKKLLQSLKSEKQYYSIEDIKIMKDLIIFLSENFKEKGQHSTTKGILSSKEKEIWICKCGKQVTESSTYCKSCGNDIFGFKENEISAINAIEIFQEKIDIISKALE